MCKYKSFSTFKHKLCVLKAVSAQNERTLSRYDPDQHVPPHLLAPARVTENVAVQRVPMETQIRTGNH